MFESLDHQISKTCSYAFENNHGSYIKDHVIVLIVSQNAVSIVVSIYIVLRCRWTFPFIHIDAMIFTEFRLPCCCIIVRHRFRSYIANIGTAFNSLSFSLSLPSLSLYPTLYRFVYTFYGVFVSKFIYDLSFIANKSQLRVFVQKINYDSGDGVRISNKQRNKDHCLW